MLAQSNIAVGTCDGTGAAIYVCLGWVPQKVELYNFEDAGNLLPRATWVEGFQLITAVDEGLLEKIGTTYYAPSGLASAGITKYNGGDELKWDSVSARFEDAAGNDVSEKYVDGYYQKASGGAAYRCYGAVVDPAHTGATFKTAPGFALGADADLNADGEQIIWVAYR